eukprot:COSAG06_NODE_13116_length_1291_cov_2.157718_1_plen_107_part_10
MLRSVHSRDLIFRGKWQVQADLDLDSGASLGGRLSNDRLLSKRPPRRLRRSNVVQTTQTNVRINLALSDTDNLSLIRTRHVGHAPCSIRSDPRRVPILVLRFYTSLD